MKSPPHQVSSCRADSRSTRALRRPPRRAVQGELFARTWGGFRDGAGRKLRAARRRVDHRTRENFRPGCPVHVTLRLVDGLPSLRDVSTYRSLLRALGAGSERFGLRLVHWSVLGNHLHLLVEAADRFALARGMQGLAVRLARAINRVWRRVGTVFADRYHAHVLRSPREVRSALCYVLQNARRHRIRIVGADPFSSGPWFDGWIQGGRVTQIERERLPWLQAARTWLLARGWRRGGPLDVHSGPAGA